MTGWRIPAGLLTREEVAELLRAESPRTVDRLRRVEGLPAVRVGRSYRYRKEAVLAWVATRERAAS